MLSKLMSSLGRGRRKDATDSVAPAVADAATPKAPPPPKAPSTKAAPAPVAPEAPASTQTHALARKAAEAAREQAEHARSAADADLAAALGRVTRAEAEAARAVAAQTQLRTALDEARARADQLDEARAAEAAATAELATMRAALASARGQALSDAARAFDLGEAPMAPALAEAQAFCARNGRQLALAERLNALAALGEGGAGLVAARRHIAAARAFDQTLAAADAEDIAVLDETLANAVRLGAALEPGPEGATAAGLPRLAEALWRDRAELAGDDAARAGALSHAAQAALWGGRWPVAAALAGRAVGLLDQTDDPATLLTARLTQAQARLFAGVADAPALVAELAEDANAALGAEAPVTVAATRLAARVAFEAGDAEAGEALAARLVEGGVDPSTDPAIRTARARGLLIDGKPHAARGLFDALARQQQAGSRAALGHRLDALEAALADDGDPAEVSAALDELAPQITEVFGARHARCGQLALLMAMAAEVTGDADAAADALARAQALLALRLDPAHRWRVAAAALSTRLEAGPGQMGGDDAPSVMTVEQDDAEATEPRATS